MCQLCAVASVLTLPILLEFTTWGCWGGAQGLVCSADTALSFTPPRFPSSSRQWWLEIGSQFRQGLAKTQASPELDHSVHYHSSFCLSAVTL